MAALKVKTDIITRITVSLIGEAVILVIMLLYVKTFKTEVIVFICNVIMCLRSHWPIIISISRLVVTDNITVVIVQTYIKKYGFTIWFLCVMMIILLKNYSSCNIHSLIEKYFKILETFWTIPLYLSVL
jgi:hypothetical protein